MNRIHIMPLAASFLALAVVAGCAKPPARLGPQPPQAAGDTVTFAAGAPQLAFIDTTVAEPQRLALAHLTGRVVWNDDCTVRVYAPVAGRVDAVETDVGATVSAGSALARMRSPDFDQAVADARATAANALVADKAFARARDLLAHGAAAEKDVEVAQAAAAAAVAERDRAAARLALFGGGAADPDSTFVLRSPLPGEVVERNLNPGQEVRPDQMLANATNLFAPLFVISDPGRLWLQLDVPEWELAAVRPGDRLRITAPAFPGRVFGGRIDNVGSELDPGTLAARVRGVVDNPGGLLKAGMYVLVDVERDGPPAAAGVEVPSSAVFLVANRPCLFVETRQGRFRRCAVETGTEMDGRIPVLTGVTAGQRVVTEGALLLQSILEPSG